MKDGKEKRIKKNPNKSAILSPAFLQGLISMKLSMCCHSIYEGITNVSPNDTAYLKNIKEE